MEERDDDVNLRVCHECIGDRVLKAEIVRDGRAGECGFCANDNTNSVTIAAFGRRVDDIFQKLVGIAPDTFVDDGGHFDFRPVGESPSFLMTEMTEAADDRIGEAVVDYLSSCHEWDVRDGGTNFYDDTSETYAISAAAEGGLKERWTTFCLQLKQERRFFLSEGADLLDEILTPLLDGKWPDGGAIRTIGPNDANRFIYRGRVANDDGASAEILRHHLSQLSAAQPGQASSGRMNPAGVSVFYGAFDPITCVAELRVPVGGSAIVGCFEIMRPLRVLDLTRLETAVRPLSYFEDNYFKLLGYSNFVRGFHEEVRQAVIPGKEMLDYLPTQIVAEYLWSRTKPPFDGLIFGSSQISTTKNNIVLFPHAATVEGVDQDPKRTINFTYTTTDENGENVSERVLFDPLPNPLPAAHRLTLSASENDWFASLPQEAEGEQVRPALRLAADGVSRHRVSAIVYDTEPAVPISFSDWEETPFLESPEPPLGADDDF